MRSVQRKSSETGQSGAELFCSAADQATKGLQSGHHGQVCSRSLSPRTSLSRHLPILPESTDNQSLSLLLETRTSSPGNTWSIGGYRVAPPVCNWLRHRYHARRPVRAHGLFLRPRQPRWGRALDCAARQAGRGPPTRHNRPLRLHRSLIWNAWASLSIVPKPERFLALGSVVPLFSPIIVSPKCQLP